MRDWAEHAIWWQVYPLGFLGAERSALSDAGVQHRLPRLESWLDYAIDLGTSGIALGPVFASETHGYDTIDHFRVDAGGGAVELDLAGIAGLRRDVDTAEDLEQAAALGLGPRTAAVAARILTRQ